MSAETYEEREARLARVFNGERIDWSLYSDSEMERLAAAADTYGYVRILRKIQKATHRRDLRRQPVSSSES